MLVAHHNHGLPFGEGGTDELQAVANGTRVTRVWVKQVFRPPLGRLTVVPERAGELDLNRPSAGNDDVTRRPAARVALRTAAVVERGFSCRKIRQYGVC